MRIRSLALGLSAVALLAGACHRKAETPPPPVATAPPPAAQSAPEAHAGFSHQANFDAAGFYFTQSNIKSGTWRLAQMGVGAPSDFETWEKGDRASAFGPIMFEFEDLASSTQTGETGAESHTGRIRVLPDSYTMDDQKLSFTGHDAKLGAVSFTGDFDKSALAEAKANGSGQMAVLSGTLKVGEKTYDRVSFTYFVGD